MVQGEASPARAWTAAEPLVSRYNEKGRVVGELEVPRAAGFGLDERVRVPTASLIIVLMMFSQRDHGDGVFLVPVRREVDSRSSPSLPSDSDTSVERHPFILRRRAVERRARDETVTYSHFLTSTGFFSVVPIQERAPSNLA